jgi:sigma-B regulation protein RsbU (phosphoserine phosphatase)
LAEIDARRRIVRYVNCGHNPALLLRERGGETVSMDSSCPPLGMFASEACQVVQSELNAGDMIVFYTDGLPEAENPNGDAFGMDRLEAVVRANSELPAAQIINVLFGAAVDFRGSRNFTDDVTIVVVKCDFVEPDLILHGATLASSLQL